MIYHTCIVQVIWNILWHYKWTNDWCWWQNQKNTLQYAVNNLRERWAQRCNKLDALLQLYQPAQPEPQTRRHPPLPMAGTRRQWRDLAWSHSVAHCPQMGRCLCPCSSPLALFHARTASGHPSQQTPGSQGPGNRERIQMSSDLQSLRQWCHEMSPYWASISNASLLWWYYTH